MGLEKHTKKNLLNQIFEVRIYIDTSTVRYYGMLRHTFGEAVIIISLQTHIRPVLVEMTFCSLDKRGRQ